MPSGCHRIHTCSEHPPPTPRISSLPPSNNTLHLAPNADEEIADDFGGFGLTDPEPVDLMLDLSLPMDRNLHAIT
jgi:hypothetical protein